MAQINPEPTVVATFESQQASTAATAKPLTGPVPGAANHLPRRLRNVLSLLDLEAAARRQLPRPIFGYISGGVEDDQSRTANRDAFAKYFLRPKVLVDVSRRSLQTELFGMRYAAPFGIAPMGICALSAFEGDLVMARAAEAAGIPFVLSGSSLTPMEEIIQAAPTCAWFQAYVPGEASAIEPLVDRAARAGFGTLVVTVDTPTLANRENNVRVGFSTPLRPTLRLAWDGIVRPRWLAGTLLRTLIRRGMPHFENVGVQRGVPIISASVVRQFGLRDHLSWTHFDMMRKLWRGKLVVKGVLRPDDVRRCEQHGADGVIISNHGGRQLDGAMSSMDALPAAAAAKGGMTLMLDSGVRRGTDVIKAMCLGADFVFVGRPMVYAAAVGAQAGVGHAIQLLADELMRDLALLGVNGPGELDPDCLERA